MLLVPLPCRSTRASLPSFSTKKTKQKEQQPSAAHEPMRPPRPAFVPASPLRAPAHPSSRRAVFRVAVCCQPPVSPSSRRPRPARLPAALVATFGALLGAFARPGASPLHLSSAALSAPAAPPAKELRYDGRQELDGGEKALSLSLTLGTFAVLGVWAWKQNRRDDELENIRIREEVDRLEKMRAEFVDVEEDDDSLDDEDLLASLKQRISEGDDAEDPNDPEAPEDPEAESPTNENEQLDDNSESGSSSDPGSVDMLRRMWDATDEDSKKDKS